MSLHGEAQIPLMFLTQQVCQPHLQNQQLPHQSQAHHSQYNNRNHHNLHMLQLRREFLYQCGRRSRSWTALMLMHGAEICSSTGDRLPIKSWSFQRSWPSSKICFDFWPVRCFHQTMETLGRGRHTGNRCVNLKIPWFPQDWSPVLMLQLLHDKSYRLMERIALHPQEIWWHCHQEIPQTDAAWLWMMLVESFDQSLDSLLPYLQFQTNSLSRWSHWNATAEDSWCFLTIVRWGEP